MHLLHMNLSTLLLSIAILACTIGTTSCSAGTVDSQPQSTQGSTPVETANTVPADFPIPVYPKHTSASVQKGTYTDTLFIETPDSVEQIASYYQNLPDWKVDGEVNKQNDDVSFKLRKGDKVAPAHFFKGAGNTQAQIHLNL